MCCVPMFFSLSDRRWYFIEMAEQFIKHPVPWVSHVPYFFTPKILNSNEVSARLAQNICLVGNYVEFNLIFKFLSNVLLCLGSVNNSKMEHTFYGTNGLLIGSRMQVM